MALAKYNPTWQQTMLRVKDPLVSLDFYGKLGFQLLSKRDFPEWKFTVYFIAIPHPKHPFPEGEKEREDFLFRYPGVTLELTHNHGTESDPNARYDGQPKNAGFGHIALHTDDVYKSSEELEARGVVFRKRPDEGRMKGIAFFYDPDGYWIELVKRSPESPWKGIGFSLSQTMLRVKDAKKSLAFYCDLFGMKVMHQSHYGPDAGDFSLFFVQDASQQEERVSENTHTHINSCFHPVLELTHNHGTENDANFAYHDHNTEPRGFGHIGFLVDNIDEFMAEAERLGVRIKKRPHEGGMRKLGFLYDPDGYWIEIIQRGVNFDQLLGK